MAAEDEYLRLLCTWKSEGSEAAIALCVVGMNRWLVGFDVKLGLMKGKLAEVCTCWAKLPDNLELRVAVQRALLLICIFRDIFMESAFTHQSELLYCNDVDEVENCVFQHRKRTKFPWRIMTHTQWEQATA